MSGYVLFEMWPPFQQSLIDAHLFYVEQARKRLLSQFENIEQEADNAEQAWLEEHKGSFNPEWDDEGSFVERAFDASIEFYQLLTNMRQQTYINVTAGMFHEWDKQLRS